SMRRPTPTISTLFPYTTLFRSKQHKYKDDHRFKIANKEALIGCGLAIINFVWWYGFACGLGDKRPEEYQYIFGLPAWFFLSCVVGLVVMIARVTIVVKLFLSEVRFEHEPPQEIVGDNGHDSELGCFTTSYFIYDSSVCYRHLGIAKNESRRIFFVRLFSR